MRILFRIHRATVGGSQRSFLQLAGLLAARGVEVEFAGEGGEQTPAGRFGGFRFHELPYRPFAPASAAGSWGLLRLLRRGNFDILQVNGAFLGLEAAVPAAVTGTPVIVTLPGGRLPILPTSRMHGIVCFSEELRDALETRGRRPDRVLLVGNRIDCDGIRRLGEGETGNGIRSYEPAPGETLVTMTSRLDPGKQEAVAHVFRAARILRSRRRDFRLVLIGGGSGEERIRRNRDRIHAETGDEFLFMTGQVDNPIPLVRKADVVLGVGLSALEGMVFGIPALIVGECGFAGAVTPEGVRRLQYFNFSGRNRSEPEDPEKLAGELDRLMSDPERRREIGEFGRTYVHEHLDLKDVVPLYRDFYREVLRDRKGRLGETGRAILYTAAALVRAFLDRRRRRRGDAGGGLSPACERGLS